MTENERPTITESKEDSQAKQLRMAADAIEQGDIELCFEIIEGVREELKKTIDTWKSLTLDFFHE